MRPEEVGLGGFEGVPEGGVSGGVVLIVLCENGRGTSYQR